MSREHELIVHALEELSSAVEDLSRQLGHTEQYLISNLRTYNPGNSFLLSGRLASVRNNIYRIKQLASTNKDNAHLLINDEEKKRTPRIEPIRIQDIDLGTQIPDVFLMRRD